MYHLYSLLFTLGFLVLLPRFLVDAFFHGKYAAGFRERLGFLRPAKSYQPTIWLHCVSVGETQAARPLADLLLQNFPGHSLVISTTTLTGQNLAREIFKEKASRVFYFPFDWRWSVRRTLNVIRPAAVLLMETELWPNFLQQSRAQDIPVALVNGRLSHKSTGRYLRIKPFSKHVVNNLSLAIMQTEPDSARLSSLGFPAEKTFVAGSLKFDAGTIAPRTSLTEHLRQRFGLDGHSHLILAASTHANEERILIDSFQIVQKLQPEARLMIAPRHPERFGEVVALLKESGLSWKRRTEPETSFDRECEVILLDTIGELTAVYSLASLVFVGGSIANFGGHNVVEPAAVGSCIITGSHTHNFESIVAEFVKAGALVQLPQLNEPEIVPVLARALGNLFNSPEVRSQMGTKALLLVQQNLGTAQKTVDLIKRHLIT
jgi:3-deoxy-D-manno-octulosonic-acid transferase